MSRLEAAFSYFELILVQSVHTLTVHNVFVVRKDVVLCEL